MVVTDYRKAKHLHNKNISSFRFNGTLARSSQEKAELLAYFRAKMTKQKPNKLPVILNTTLF